MAVSLHDPSDLLSVDSITETYSVNSRTYTDVYESAFNRYTASTPEGRQEVTTVDDADRVTSVQFSCCSYPIRYNYNARGELEQVVWGPGDDPSVDRIYQMSYDPNGRLQSITDPLGQTSGLAYDPAGRPTELAYPAGGQLAMSYDANGNLDTITPVGQPTHEFEHTPVDQVAVYQPPPLPDVPAPSTQYAYNLDRQPHIGHAPGWAAD